MIRLTGTQRELMEIIWEAGEITLHDIAKAALGNSVTMNRTDAVRVVLMQMVTKGAISEDKTVSPHIFRPECSRDEVGYEVNFGQDNGQGSALFTAFSAGGFGSLGGGGVMSATAEPGGPQGPKYGNKAPAQSEDQREAVKAMMEQICRERDEYMAEKAKKKAEEEANSTEE